MGGRCRGGSLVSQGVCFCVTVMSAVEYLQPHLMSHQLCVRWYPISSSCQHQLKSGIPVS